jgi:uroporphyrinogen decarboxylase
MLSKREIIHMEMEGGIPPYVPWSCGFTKEAKEKLARHFNLADLENALQNHLLKLGSDIGFFSDLGNNHVQDVFGVIWDRSIDRDIGGVEGHVLDQPTLEHYTFPDPLDQRFFKAIPERIDKYGDRFRVFQVGFSLYKRAWSLRGLQNLLMDFYDHPQFIRDLLNTIADYNIAQVQEALKFDIDVVYFGDDWGQQRGLQMAPKLWREFLYPVLTRMYAAGYMGGKYVFIHSCGDVDELFDALIAIGVNCFDPFQPEVMDVNELLGKHRHRLCFHGGLSTQKTLPFGTVGQVRQETRPLLEMGQKGGISLPPHTMWRAMFPWRIC